MKKQLKEININIDLINKDLSNKIIENKILHKRLQRICFVLFPSLFILNILGIIY